MPIASNRIGAKAVRERDVILRIQEVMARTGLRRSTLYKKIAEDTFPKQVRISQNCVGWYESSIEAWISCPK